MSKLFHFFLLFCSKDFIHFYRRLRKKGVVNQRVVSFLTWSAVSYMAIFFAISFALYEKAFGSLGLFSWQTRVWIMIVCLIIFLFCYSLIKKREEAAFAYSDGVVVVGELISKAWTKKGFVLKYRFDVGGKDYFLSKDPVSIFKARKVSLGHQRPIIYAKSAPRFATFYDPFDFMKYCLDTTKEQPKIEMPEREYIH